jgi:hypothetical protein
VYYFASPRIRPGRVRPFDLGLLREYLAYYVDGAARVLELARPADGFLCFVWPSTVFVDQGGDQLPEYVAAKVVGEAWCREVARRVPAVHVACPRLPRLETDQAQSVQPGRAESALAPMLRLVRETASCAHTT